MGAFWLAFVLYFLAILYIGLSVRKKNATTSDLIMGSRGVNFWVTALSAQASDMSSWLFMAFPMSIFLGGMPQIWIAIALLLGMFATWHFVAPRLRVETEKYASYTLSSYFSKRYQDTSGIIRLISAAWTLLFLTYYLSAGLISIGILFESLFNMNYMVGITLASCAIVLYTFIGGFVSVAWVDFFQAIFLLGVIIVVPVITFSKIDGINAISLAASAQNISLSFVPTSLKDFFFPLFGWGLGYFGMPHIITKFMGIDNPQNLRKAKYLGISWEILALFAAAACGLIGIAYFPQGLDDPQLVFVKMVVDIFPPFLVGLSLCGVLAATISTMDSQILVAASVVAEDLYKQFAKTAKDKMEKIVFRLAVVVIAVCAFSIATSRNTTIMETVFYAWGGLGSAFGPLVLTSLYWKGVTRSGAIAGLITGGSIAALWPMLNKQLNNLVGLGPVPATIPGFFLGLFMIFIVSFLTSKKREKFA